MYIQQEGKIQMNINQNIKFMKVVIAMDASY